MRRAAASADQLAAPLSRHIFMTEITQSDGAKMHVMSSQPLSDRSVRMNRAWIGKRWEGKEYVSGQCTNAGALFLLMTLCSRGNISYRNMVCDVWKEILGFTFRLKQHEQLESLGNYAVAIRRPLSLFQTIKMDLSFVSFVVDAVMRGQEDMVMNVLRANPDYLLQYAPVKNSVGIESIRSPLQAAIMANDIQMVENMQKHFARLSTDFNGDPLDGLDEMHRQIKEIYTSSLQRYWDIQKEKMVCLTALQDRTPIDAAEYAQIDAQLTQCTSNCQEYSWALMTDDIQIIVDIHHQAQEHNAFDFQPYVDAILNASQEELDATMELINATSEKTADVITRTGVAATQTDADRAKPFEQLTLVQKLNRFREELKAHAQQEVIFNPNHILAGMRHNEKIWDDVDAGRIADPNHDKRSVIFSQLVGWAERNASEPVKQDIRQGIWYFTEQNEARRRSSRFRRGIVDLSCVDSSRVDGLGYQFGVSAQAVMVIRRGGPLEGFFKTYLKQKIATFQNLLRGRREHMPMRVKLRE